MSSYTTAAHAGKHPSVGIILTTYNGEQFVRAQLDSLLAQVGVSVHIYAFDDCSSDSTLSILRSYEDAYPGIFSVYANRKNSGGTGLNVLLNLPRVPRVHDFVAMADQDDVWFPQKLQRAIEELTKSHAGLYFSNLLAWGGDKEVLGVVEKAGPLRAHDHIFGGGSAGCTYVLSKPFFAHVQEVLSRTDFSSARRVSHDWMIYFLARHDGYGVCASPDAFIKYRIHSDSQYGGMWRGGIGAVHRKVQMVRAGFLREQIDNALLVARDGTTDREILLGCKRGRCARLAILARYGFSLVRSKRRFFYLAFALLLFR